MDIAESSGSSRDEAESTVRRIDRLLREARRKAASETRKIREQLVRDYQQNGGMTLGPEKLAALQAEIAALMIASDLTSRAASARRAAEVRKAIGTTTGSQPARIPGRRIAEPTRMLGGQYDAIAESLRKRLAIDPAGYDMIRARYSDAAAQTISRFLRGVRSKVGQAAAQAAADGLSTKGAVSAVRAAMNDMGLSPAEPRLIETLFRTQSAVAYSAGRWTFNNTAAIDEILWGYEYVTVGDDRVRPAHAALDGVRLPKDDPFWLTNSTPNGYNCRCDMIEIYKGSELARPVEAPDGEVTIDGQRVRPGPDKGWDFNPGQVFAGRQ